MLHQSPQWRWIEDVEGNPGDIMRRGEQITSLGEKMRLCADELQRMQDEDISDGSQKGKAIAALKESIGDSYEVLRQAAELYKPVGPVITYYGAELGPIQTTIKGLVEDCETKWEAYQRLPGDKDGSTTPEAGGGFLGIGGHDADSQEAKDEASDNAAKSAAYEDWKLSADDFDDAYDSWETLFTDAERGIENKMSDSIKDSFWKQLLDGLATVLSYAALVAGILALVLAGPFAGIALALAAAYLAVTSVQYLMGDKSLLDVGLAALGVIPFGKVGLLFTKGGKMAFLKEAIKPLKEMRGGFAQITAVNRLAGLKPGTLSHALSWGKVAFQKGNQNGAADLLPRIFLGKDAAGFDNLKTFHLTDVAASLWDIGHSAAGVPLKYNGWFSTATGNSSESWLNQYPVLNAIW